MNKETISKILLFTIGIILVLIFFVPTCSNEKVTAPNKDTIVYKENQVNKDIDKVLNDLHILKQSYDSLKARKPIIVIKYKTKYDSLVLADTSCQNSLIMLYNSFGELNDLNDSIIAKSEKRLLKDSVLIENLNEKISLSKQRIFVDSIYINRLTDTLPKVKRKGFIRGFKVGFATGTILTGGSLGSLMVK